MSVLSRAAWDVGEFAAVIVGGGFSYGRLHAYWRRWRRWRPCVRDHAGAMAIVVKRPGMINDIVVARFGSPWQAYSDDAFAEAWAQAEERAMAMNVREGSMR